MDTEASMHTSTGEADKDTKLGRCPLWGRRIAVAADIVLGFFLESRELFTVSVSAFASASQSDEMGEGEVQPLERGQIKN